jgi:hypothetical protein
MAFMGLPWPTKSTGCRSPDDDADDDPDDDADDDGEGGDDDRGSSDGISASRGRQPAAAAAATRNARRETAMARG